MEKALNSSKNHGRPRKRSDLMNSENKHNRRPRGPIADGNTRQRRRRDVHSALRPEATAEHVEQATGTESLELFLRQARVHPLLTAAEEVELAQQIERGDLEAKERMINANLRLV